MSTTFIERLIAWCSLASAVLSGGAAVAFLWSGRPGHAIALAAFGVIILGVLKIKRVQP